MLVLPKNVEIGRAQPHLNFLKRKILKRSLLPQLHLVRMVTSLENLEIAKKTSYQTQLALHLPQKRRKKNLLTMKRIALAAAPHQTRTPILVN